VNTEHQTIGPVVSSRRWVVTLDPRHSAIHEWGPNEVMGL